MPLTSFLCGMQGLNFNGPQTTTSTTSPKKAAFCDRKSARVPAAPCPRRTAWVWSASGSRKRRPRRARPTPRSRGAIVLVSGEWMAGRYCRCSGAAVALSLARTRAARRTLRVCAPRMYYTRGNIADGDGCSGGGEVGRAERRMVLRYCLDI